MTLKKASTYLRWSDEQLQSVIDEINALAENQSSNEL